MADFVIEVSVPQSTDIYAQADTVDVVADAGGAQVIVVATPGPPGPAGPAGSPGDGTQVFNEIPSGLRNGTNPVLTLAHTPHAGSTTLYRNGLRESLGIGYTVTGSDITFTVAPLSSDEITVDYLMEG